MSSFGHQPFKPSFGGKVIVPGCSDKSSRASLQEQSQAGPKLTTYARTAAALEAYWAQRAAAGSAPVGPGLPGGEKALAYKTREACWKDSVHLEHHAGAQLPECQGVPADIEDKETVRTRGITGFTGKQPLPGCSKPPAPAPDTSRWVAINAFDEPRPRVKGIVGYTGHQPPSPVKVAGQGAAAVGPGTTADTQHADQLGIRPGVKTAWGSAASSGPAAQQQQQQQQQQGYAGAAAAAAAHCGAHVPSSAGTASRMVARPGVEAGDSSYAGRPGSTASSCYAPRFFIDGEEVAAERMQQLQPPHSASVAEQQQRAPSTCCSQQVTAGVQPAAWAAPGPPQPQLAWGASSSTGIEQSAGSSSSRCYSSHGYPGTAPGAACNPSYNTSPDPQYGSRSSILAAQPVGSQLPRTRATSYAAASSPAAGFNFQQYMDSLKLAGSMRPGSAAAAYTSYQQQQRQGGMR